MSVLVDGSANSKLLVVGMSPGREELKVGKPFMGGSGVLLWGTLKKIGLDRSDCFIVNCIGEWPGGKNAEVTEEQLDKYWDAVEDALKSFTGRTVLLLGSTALARYTGLSSIESWRGYVLRPDELPGPIRRGIHHTVYKTNTKLHKKGDPREVKQRVKWAPPLGPNVETIIATIHPAAVLRSGFATVPAFTADAQRAGKAAQGPLAMARESYSVGPAHLPGTVAFDIETGGADSDLITQIGFANQNEAWTAFWDDVTLAHTKRILADPETTKVAHNITFDLPRLEAAGVEINGPIYDTMLAANLLQPDLYKGLNSVIPLYLNTNRHKHLSDTDPTKYNALDVIREYELYESTTKALQETGQYELFTEGIMPAVRTLIRMSRGGIRIDQARQRTLQAELSKAHTALLAQWYVEFPGVSPTSNKALKNLFFTTLGVPKTYNKYGAESLDEDSLRNIMALSGGNSRIASVILRLLQIRHHGKMLSTYLNNLSKHTVHPSYLPASKDDETFGKGIAGTGRPTAKYPNVQNIPPEMRCLIIPHRADRVLVELDFNQIEARILAQLSGDDVLMSDIEFGLHAQNMLALNVDKVRAKNGFYGWAYGAGPTTLMRTFRAAGFAVTQPECARLLDHFNTRYRKAAAYRSAIVSDLSRTRMVENPFHRRRYFYGGSSSAPAAMNFVPQSTAADIMWRILPRVEGALDQTDGQLLATIHDSVLVELPLATLREGAAAVKDVMESHWPQIGPDFRVPVGIKYGPNWGEMTELT